MKVLIHAVNWAEITDDNGNRFLVSYDTFIVKRTPKGNDFLGETKKETEAKIKSGEYKLEDLNK